MIAMVERYFVGKKDYPETEYTFDDFVRLQIELGIQNPDKLGFVIGDTYGRMEIMLVEQEYDLQKEYQKYINEQNIKREKRENNWYIAIGIGIIFIFCAFLYVVNIAGQ